jgi:hypothetical protein
VLWIHFEILHSVLRTPFRMILESIVILNEPSGEVRDLIAEIIALRYGCTLRFFTPCYALRSE